ncbi:hypothetical protein HNY73_006029 [Argiope bruennichi]|uniref:Uncharacterized protein n=1 Tax=Argiope bruennichi TaxID=94029 RepID=A0A8T0FL49_ARGBR|nr:hypothetical protein HNY73_006029 [Argiope bruennichi]
MTESYPEASATDLSSDASLEVEDEVRILLPSSKSKDRQAASRIPHGIVISGEASESDEEIDTHQALPQSGSDYSISDAWCRSPSELGEKDSSRDSSVQYNTWCFISTRKAKSTNQTSSPSSAYSSPFDSK